MPGQKPTVKREIDRVCRSEVVRETKKLTVRYVPILHIVSAILVVIDG